MASSAKRKQGTTDEVAVKREPKYGDDESAETRREESDASDFELDAKAKKKRGRRARATGKAETADPSEWTDNENFVARWTTQKFVDIVKKRFDIDASRQPPVAMGGHCDPQLLAKIARLKRRIRNRESAQESRTRKEKEMRSLAKQLKEERNVLRARIDALELRLESAVEEGKKANAERARELIEFIEEMRAAGYPAAAACSPVGSMSGSDAEFAAPQRIALKEEPQPYADFAADGCEGAWGALEPSVANRVPLSFLGE